MNNRLIRAVLIHFLFFIFAFSVAAQEGATKTTQSQPAASEKTMPTTVDENFDLNISERRITKHNFEASTSVEFSGDAKSMINLLIGVAASATDIDVLLRNVRGHVQFRGSLESVLQRINARRGQTPSAP